MIDGLGEWCEEVAGVVLPDFECVDGVLPMTTNCPRGLSYVSLSLSVCAAFTRRVTLYRAS